MMRRVFRNEEFNEQFQEFGYVRTPLLTSSALEKLKSGYESTKNEAPSEIFYTTHWSKDKKHREEVDGIIRSELEKPTLSLLETYKSCLAIYLVKHQGSEGEFHVHQDWTLVDEKHYRGVTVWVALQDTSVSSGCIHVIPGSHRLKSPVRGFNIETPFADVREWLESEYCIPIELKAGEAIFFDHGLLHYSPPNLDSRTRLAAGLVAIPQETTLIHYNASSPEASTICKYLTDDRFLIEYGFGNLGMEEYKLLNRSKNQNRLYSRESFKREYEQIEIGKNT